MFDVILSGKSLYYMLSILKKTPVVWESVRHIASVRVLLTCMYIEEVFVEMFIEDDGVNIEY